MTADLADFDAPDLKHGFVHGGLPPFFLGDAFPERDCQEWMDACSAKDIQELFRLVYPRGENLVVCQDVARAYRRTDVRFVNLAGLIARLQAG